MKNYKRLPLTLIVSVFLSLSSAELQAQLKFPFNILQNRKLQEKNSEKEKTSQEKSEPKSQLFSSRASKKTNMGSSFMSVANFMVNMKTSYCMGGDGPVRWDCSHATTEIINRVLDAKHKPRIQYYTSQDFLKYLRSINMDIDCEDVERGDIIVWLYGHVGLVYDSSHIVSSHGSGSSGPGITVKSFVEGHLAEKSKECFENPWI